MLVSDNSSRRQFGRLRESSRNFKNQKIRRTGQNETREQQSNFGKIIEKQHKRRPNDF